MNAMLISSILAATLVVLVVALTRLIVTLTFPDESGLFHCPRRLPLRWFTCWLEWTKPLRKLTEGIHIFLAFLQAPADTEVILAPNGSWDVLHETLAMDAKSHFFDKNLRVQIAKALAQITILE